MVEVKLQGAFQGLYGHILLAYVEHISPLPLITWEIANETRK